jgi:ketosteroid isomerase-like protein
MKEDFIMRLPLLRLAVTVAFAATFLAPLNASADALSPAQMTALNNGTKTYFKAVYNLDYAALKGITAPGFAIIKDGKPIGDKLAGQLQAAKMTMSNVSGGIDIASATMAGNTVTENVTLNAQGVHQQGTADASRRTLTSKHVLTWTQTPGGKWLLARDVVVSAHTTAM